AGGSGAVAVANGGGGAGVAAAAGASRGAPAAAAAGSGGAPPRFIDARLSHQRGEVQHPMGPHAAAAAAAVRGVTAAAAAPAGPAAAAAAGGGGGGGEQLRAARESAELRQRGAVQLAGLPTSVEGFKGHPAYVLKRHIGKYEALHPGTAPLGLHRGEPYYPRQQLSVLHTAERWRR
ncbi:hypothetical protein Agub_g498, partial [Astrephomene gubernaculifera]